MSASDDFKIGDEVYIEKVELPHVMGHLLGKTLKIVDIRSGSMPLVIRGDWSAEDFSQRNWYFRKSEVVPITDSKEIFKRRKQELDKKLEDLRLEFAQFEKDLSEYNKTT